MRSIEPDTHSLAVLYRWLWWLISVALLMALLAYYSLTMLGAVNVLNQQRAVNEFRGSVTAVRAAWQARKPQRVELAQINGNLSRVASVSFALNEQGWPLRVIGDDRPTCEALFVAMQSQPWSRELTAQLQQHLGTKVACEYRYQGQHWFRYRFVDGQLVLARSD